MSTQDPNQRPIPAKLPPLETPLENIALAFSGGGFRAASFALGTLAYLNHIDLLKKVTYLSSASGGTIATAMYALNNAEGKDFGAFYKKLYENLEGVDLLQRVFEILNNKKKWKARPSKRPNFINSFALAYDELLFDGKRVSALKGSQTTHLQEVCFNTTEFYRGILFRQAVKMQHDSKERKPGAESTPIENGDPEGDKTFLYGNFIINLQHKAAENLKIADLMAASSCFPAGFEPIIFPADFENSDGQQHYDAKYFLKHLTVEPQELNLDEMNLLYGAAAVKKIIAGLPKPVDVKKLQETAKNTPLQEDFKAGFMDGGITDNQGVESMMRANDRRVKRETDFKPFDLMMACDVGSHFMDPYQLPEKIKNEGMTVNSLRWICGLVALAGLAAIWWGARHMPGGWPLAAILAGGLGVFAGLSVITGLWYIKYAVTSGAKEGKLNLNNTFSPQIVAMMFGYFGATPLPILKLMLTERASSILILNNSVFLKRIRQLLYQRFFDEDRCSGREKASHVYDLSFTNDTNRLENDPLQLAPSIEIQLVAEKAFQMGTTLWFDKKSQEEYTEAALVACGQFTTCYNLLAYLTWLKEDNSIYGNFTEEVKKRLEGIEKEMQAHYDAFKKNPFWLYNEQCRAYINPGWKDYLLTDMKLPQGFEGLRY